MLGSDAQVRTLQWTSFAQNKAVKIARLEGHK